MRWHYENKRQTGVLCHPSDGLAWKHFDERHPEFALDPRNVRLGLCADGFNPFNQSGTPYSCWHVIVTPYNLPPELCMTTPYMFLTCLIPGPHNPKSRIDVYLQPLIDELNILWLDGVETYDISMKNNFQMKAALMWTINDYPAYGMLSGWTTAGKLACAICMEHTKSFRLKHGGKMSWFDCHRQFLPPDHRFRRNKDAFYKGRIERSNPPVRKNGEELWEEVCTLSKIINVPLSNGKFSGYGVTHNWTKQSIFWDLPYWKDNLVRHNLDVMHIEKNVFDNVINTVMDVKGKTKDNEKARLDLVEHCSRSELHLTYLPSGKIIKPKACFTLTDEEKRELCAWIESFKMPDGYASNLTRCVDKSRQRLHGLKSHDCHVFMQRLLPYAFLSSLQPAVRNALTELSQFFRDLCATELQIDELQQLEQNIPVILCKLERIFPPGFFDVMEHLTVHLPYEAMMCGPVHYRWMYQFERFLHDLKGMVKNRAKVEGSICEAYLAQETAYFSSYYFDTDVQSKSTRIRRNEEEQCNNKSPYTLSVFKQSGRSAGKCMTRFLTDAEYNAISFHVLTQCDEVIEFTELYKSSVRHYWPDISELEVDDSFEKNFIHWFREYVRDSNNMVQNPYLKDLAWGPSKKVKTYSRYFVNGYLFHIESWSEHKKTYNSGICVKGEGSLEFYGKLKEVVELDYPGLHDKKVVLFNCDWFDTISNRGIKIHPQYGHIEIKITEKYPKFDPFVLAQHASQVYYVPYAGRRRDKMNWRFVIKTRPRSRVNKEYTVVAPALQEDRTTIRLIIDLDGIGSLIDPNGISEEVLIEDTSHINRNEIVSDESDIETTSDDIDFRESENDEDNIGGSEYDEDENDV